jgi:hypothetical protein
VGEREKREGEGRKEFGKFGEKTGLLFRFVYFQKSREKGRGTAQVSAFPLRERKPIIPPPPRPSQQFS